MTERATMTMDEANAVLTAPGQMFEIEEIEIRGVPTKVWKSAPATLRAIFDLTLAHGDGHPVAGRDAVFLAEPPRKARGHPVVLGEGDPLVLVHEERRIPVGAGLLEDRRQCRRRVLPHPGRNAPDRLLTDLEPLARRGEAGVRLLDRQSGRGVAHPREATEAPDSR